MTPIDPTPRQVEVLRAIYRHLQEHDCYPTLRQLSAHLGCACDPGVVSHLESLARKGFITWARRGYAHHFRLSGLRLVPAFDDTPQGRRLRELLAEPAPESDREAAGIAAIDED